MRQYVELLRRNRDLRYIWFAEVVSLVGDWFSQVVLLALVASRSPEGHEGLAVSTLILARFVPPLMLSPLAGVLLDRFNRQRILILSNYLRAACGVLFLIAVLSPDMLWLIYAGIILQAILGTVYMPGQSALVASVVAPQDLVTANTLSSATWSAALALGGALGGFVAAAFGSTVALIIDISTFLIAGTFLLGVRGYVFVPTAKPVASSPSQPETSFADGLRYIRSRPATLATLFIKFGGSLGNVDSIMTILATQIFVLGVNGQLSLGIFYSAFGLGSIVGPMVTNALNDGSGKSLRRWILIGFIGQALGWLLIGWASTVLLLCLALMLRGMSGSVNWTYSTVLLQRTTPDHYRGRVFAFDMMFFNLATAFATIVHGTLIDSYSAINVASIRLALPPDIATVTARYLGTGNITVVAFGTALLSLLPLAVWVWAQRRWKDDAPAASPGLERAQYVADA